MIPTSREDAIERLSRQLRELRVEYEKFFNGALDIPPAEEHTRLGKEIRSLRNAKQMNAVDRFRLGQLEARFNSYSELFNRRLRYREEVGRATAPNAPGATTDRLAWNAREGVLIEDQLPQQAVEALYGELVAGGNKARFDLESFRVYLSQQAGAIRRKTGCSGVRFRIVEEAGETKLKAKPVRTDAGADG
jgi:hypothetical protein